MAEDKPHWVRLKDLFKCYGNGEATIKFQDGLPLLIVEIRGERNNIDLLKE